MKIDCKYNTFIIYTNKDIGKKMKWIPNSEYDKVNKRWFVQSSFWEYILSFIEENKIDYKCSISAQELFESKKRQKEKEIQKYNLCLNKYVYQNKPYKHQEEGIEYLLKNKKCGLFDEQGLGKTFQCIITFDILSRLNDIDFLLIVCDKTVRYVWLEEFGKFASGYLDYMQLLDISASQKLRKKYNNIPVKNLDKLKDTKILIINYEQLVDRKSINRENKNVIVQSKFRAVVENYMKDKKRMLIVDECHRIKNPKAKITSVFLDRNFQFDRVIMTSGTPIADKPEDVFTSLKIMDAPVSNYYHFTGKFCEFDRYKNIKSYKNLDEFENIIQNSSIRRLKDNCLDLPKKIYQNLYLELEGKQLDLYNQAKEELKIEILKEGRKDSLVMANILTKLLRLSQITTNPSILTDEFRTQDSVKVKALFDIIENNPKEKVVVWTTYKQNVYKLLEEFKKYNPLSITGDIKDRAEVIDKFQNDKNYRLLFCTSAAKQGITLHAASIAVYLDRNWSLSYWLQSQDRIHRIGQVNDCLIIKLLCLDTIDELIDKRLEKKKYMAEGLQGDVEVTWNDIEDLLT